MPTSPSSPISSLSSSGTKKAASATATTTTTMMITNPTFIYRGIVCVGIFMIIGLQLLNRGRTELCLTDVIHARNEFGMNPTTVSSTSSTTSTTTHKSSPVVVNYQPAIAENYLIEHSKELNFHGTDLNTMGSGCDVWDDRSLPVRRQLLTFRDELKQYNILLDQLMKRKQEEKKQVGSALSSSNSLIHAIRRQYEEQQQKTNNNNNNNGNSTSSYHDVCNTLELHPKGIVPGIFSSDGIMSHSTTSGWMEPLLPPMRDPNFCRTKNDGKKDWTQLMSLSYLVHDFAKFCRMLRPTSRIVLFDLGAALDFHDRSPNTDELMKMPAIYAMTMFQSLGFTFDHIYAYEISQKDPKKVYDKIPDELKAAYHWYNVGISQDVDSPYNPWNILQQNFNVDDFVIVKLDIDHADIEKPLAKQLLTNMMEKQQQQSSSSSSSSSAPSLTDLIDIFYFEDHVYMRELAGNWGTASMRGSIATTMELFTKFRQLGIAAHFWV